MKKHNYYTVIPSFIGESITASPGLIVFLNIIIYDVILTVFLIILSTWFYDAQASKMRVCAYQVHHKAMGIKLKQGGIQIVFHWRATAFESYKFI